MSKLWPLAPIVDCSQAQKSLWWDDSHFLTHDHQSFVPIVLGNSVYPFQNVVFSEFMYRIVTKFYAWSVDQNWLVKKTIYTHKISNDSSSVGETKLYGSHVRVWEDFTYLPSSLHSGKEPWFECFESIAILWYVLFMNCEHKKHQFQHNVTSHQPARISWAQWVMPLRRNWIREWIKLH